MFTDWYAVAKSKKPLRTSFSSVIAVLTATVRVVNQYDYPLPNVLILIPETFTYMEGPTGHCTLIK